MGLFKKRASDPAEMEALKADIAKMAARLDQVDADKADIGSKVQSLASRLDTPVGPPPSAPPPPPPVAVAAVSEADIDIIRARLQRLSDRLDQVDARITSISTELANQLSELSGELDSVSSRQPVGDDVVDEIRDAQVRLAGEQARYQIAFRQDLADLVERLRKS
jgi:prefoldin subunit 5